MEDGASDMLSWLWLLVQDIVMAHLHACRVVLSKYIIVRCSFWTFNRNSCQVQSAID